MTKSTVWLGTLCLVGAAAMAPAAGAANVSVDIDIAPPASRVEVVPAPRVGYVWAPGYWDWRGHEHVWVRGRWIREHHGRHWVPAHWVQNGRHWHMERGRWER